MTVEQTFMLASEGIDRQWGYTALSRARSGTRLYAMISAAVTSRRIRLRLRAWRMTLPETGAKRPHWSAYSDATRSPPEHLGR
jgi:hypothetical protein